MTSSISTSVVRVALSTLGLLCIPLLGNQFVDGWDWSPSDFVVMGTMIFITGMLLDRVLSGGSKNRLLIAGVIVFLFLWLWAELAVGVFTNWGS